ncbi:hypothetical protein N9792_05725 [Planktomarina temperata]|nr:hypothetical protein [Planktomarina temperata]
MAWLKFIVFILVAKFTTNIITTIIGLYSGDFFIGFTGSISFGPIVSLSLLSLITIYTAYAIIAFLMNKFPDNYKPHQGWVWINFVVFPLCYYYYLYYTYEAEVFQTIFSGWALFFEVIAGSILSFLIGERISENAKNERTQKRRIAEAKAEADAEAEAEARARAEARAENRAYHSQPPSGTGQNNQDRNIDEKHYETALWEYSDDQIVNSTYAKALVLNKGDEEAAKWTYVQLRAEKLQESEET